MNGLKWVEETSQLNLDFKNSYNEKCNKVYIIEVDIQYAKMLYSLHNGLPFLPESMKIQKLKSLFPIYTIKVNILRR